MKKIDGYWVDKHGNKWSASKKTRAEAGQASDSLTLSVDCRNCVECDDCVDCRGCSECVRCVDCSGCVSCEGCVDCSGCLDCLECEGCGAVMDCLARKKLRGIRGSGCRSKCPLAHEIRC